MNRQAPTVRTPATYQDVLDAPPNMVAELVGGTLHLQPRPASRHARASFKLAGSARRPVRERCERPGRLVSSRSSPSCTSATTSWCRTSPAGGASGWASSPTSPRSSSRPTGSARFLSPGTRRFDLTEKRALYGARGVAHLWLIDPQAETLEAFALRDGAWVLLGAVGESDEVRLPPFEAIGFPLSALWP